MSVFFGVYAGVLITTLCPPVNGPSQVGADCTLSEVTVISIDITVRPDRCPKTPAARRCDNNPVAA